MDKRIKAYIVVAVICCIGFAAPAQVQNAADTTSNREVLNFNANWKFYPTDVELGHSPALNDRDAQTVSLPHSSVLLDLFDVEPEEWRKVTWYRRTFKLPDEYYGRRVSVQFQGAGQINRVYVNGNFVGEHKGYFTSFQFDITDYITFGYTPNLIAVQVDSGEHRELPPTGSDFHYFGGIHRDVTMTVTDPVYVDWSYVWTEKTESGVALKAKVRLMNSENRARKVELSTALIDQDKKEVSRIDRESRTIKANTASIYYFTHEIDNPHLWTLDDPYLHELVSQVKVEDVLVDQHVVTTGLRWVSSDPKNSEGARVRLNGEQIRLFGINRHEQYPYLGNAGPNRYHRRDAHLLKYEAGCNVVRTSHYTNDPEFLDECDRIGLLVIAENLGWGSVGDEQWKSEFEKQLSAMILRDRNHPSVVIWSVCVNEEPDGLTEWDDKLNTIAKTLDPSRLTADHTNRNKAEFITDLYHRHDYTPDDIIQPSYQPWIVGEFNNRLGSNFVIPNDNESRKINMLLKDGIKSNLMWGDPRVAGIVRWDAFGYITPNNVEPYGQLNAFKNLGEYRNSGVFGCYRNPRFLARWWQSQADPKQVGDVVYVLSEWKSDSSPTVYAAGNADEVELLLDNRSLGKIEPNVYTDMNRGLFKWEGVEWKPESKLTARAFRQGKQVAENVRYASSYEGEEKLVLASKTGDAIIADGSDLAWIEAKIVDKNGQTCDYADANLKIGSVKGNGNVIFKTKPIQLPNPPENAGTQVIQMTDGLGVFHIQSILDQTGQISIAAAADIGVSVNNDSTGPGENTISYYPPAHWTAENRPESYGGDVHTSNSKRTSGDYILIKFTGVQVRFYGGASSKYGKAAISVDGDDEVMIDCYTLPDRHRENILLYTSPLLPYGDHELKIRVAMEKNGQSKGMGMNIDRVKIMDGKSDLESNTITVKAQKFNEKMFPRQ
jgi:beta-galactosidase